MREQGIIKELCGKFMDEYSKHEAEYYIEANDVAMAFAKLESMLIAETRKQIEGYQIDGKYSPNDYGSMILEAVLELLIGKEVEAK